MQVGDDEESGVDARERCRHGLCRCVGGRWHRSGCAVERVEEGGGEGELALRWRWHVRGVSGERSGIAGSSTVEAIAIGEWHARRLCRWSRMRMGKWLDGYVWCTHSLESWNGECVGTRWH